MSFGGRLLATYIYGSDAFCLSLSEHSYVVAYIK